jgi:hypothetical protein
MKNTPKIFFTLLLIVFTNANLKAQGGGTPPPVPPGFECCEQFAGPGPDPSQQYLDCINSGNPEQFCDSLPVDNSIYILMATGFAFASFVIFRKINHKKTPM